MTAPPVKLAPLGQNKRQEQSPIIPSDGSVPDGLDMDGRALKVMAVTPVSGAGGKVVKKVVAGGGAKRGLKRL